MIKRAGTWQDFRPVPTAPGTGTALQHNHLENCGLGGVGGDEVPSSSSLHLHYHRKVFFVPAWVSNPTPEPKECSVHGKTPLFIKGVTVGQPRGQTPLTPPLQTTREQPKSTGRVTPWLFPCCGSSQEPWKCWSQRLDATKNRTQENVHMNMTILNPGLSH